MKAEVETRYGRVRGFESRGIRIFKGIPFAAAPTGRRRFRGPRPPEPWRETRSATRPGAAPIQASVPGFRFLNLAGGVSQSEECLFVNVFTPGVDGAKRPVLVWIHGGGFLIGAGSTALYNGSGIARSGDMVVVTINYRLGALGFLSLNEIFGEDFAEASNAGVRDQIAALEWVRDNIDRFGGDPSNVTVCGQSAGAMSIAALLGSPKARSLFHRAICQSGAAGHVNSQAEATAITDAFLHQLGRDARDPDALARMPVARILKAQGAINRSLVNRKRLMAFLPVVDGKLIPEAPLDAVKRGAAADIPILIGTTLDEWKLFSVMDMPPHTMHERGLIERFAEVLPLVASRAPKAVEAAHEYRDAVNARGGKTSPYGVWSAFQSARVFHYPASQLAEAHNRAGGSTYSYLFTWCPPALRRAVGSFHALDVPFVFGVAHGKGAGIFPSFARLTPSVSRLSNAMQKAWIQFARTGDPAHEGLPSWAPYDHDARATMVLGKTCYLAHLPLEDERSLWERWSG